MNANHAKTLKKAQDYLSAGKASRAESACRKLLKHQDVFVQTRLILSKALVAQQKLSQAATYMGEAAKSQPDNTALQSAAGEMHWRLEQYGEASLFYQQAILGNPSNANIWYHLLDSALRTHKDPSQSESDHDPAALADAANLAVKALELFPTDLAIFDRAGQIFFYANMKDAAKLALEKCLETDPPILSAHQRWMEINHQDNDFQANVTHAEKNAAKLHDDPICLRATAAAYENIGLIKEALYYLEKALELRPEEYSYIAAKGRCLMHMGQFDEALASLDLAAENEPEKANVRVNRCLTQKSRGDIAAAAKDEFARLDIIDGNAKFQFETPLWDGSPLNGRRLFLYSDLGVGDVFKFTPLINEIDRSGGHIILSSQPKTVPFLQQVFPDIEIRPLPKRQHEIESGLNKKKKLVFASIEEDFDVQFPLGALYTFFRPDIASFKGKTKAFTLPADLIAPFANLDMLANPKTTKVGLAWSSINKNEIIERNYLSLEDLLPILQMPGFEFYNFQYSVKEDEINAFREKHDVPLYHAPGLDLFDDLLGTAAFNTCMDLFASPACTSSDIAGSMGVKCIRADLVHLPENLGQDHVPWYEQQESIQIPYENNILDFIPDIQKWLKENRKQI